MLFAAGTCRGEVFLPLSDTDAARGVYEAIYFKPEFYWQVNRIELLSYPSYIALRRNEVKDRISESAVKKWIRGTAEVEPLWADGDRALTGSDQKGRTQRQTMALRSPRFRLTASIVPRIGNERNQRDYDQQFERRASNGKCFQQPFLGCREFVAFFRWIDDLSLEPKPIESYSQDLGYMLYDVFDLRSDNHQRRFGKHVGDRDDWSTIKPSVSVFAARVEKGILDVPPIDSEAVLKTAIPKWEIDDAS